MHLLPWNSICIPEGLGGGPGNFVEHTAKVRLILEPHLMCNDANVLARVKEQMFCMKHAVAIQVIPG